LQVEVIGQLAEELYQYKEDISEETMQTLSDIASHSADAGWHGFTYYSDTVDFAWNNKHAIRALCREYAGEFGTSVAEMIQNFGCIGKEYGIDEINAVYFTDIKRENDDIFDVVWNALAWFALEETARKITEGA
jgi:hypothetical protein